MSPRKIAEITAAEYTTISVRIGANAATHTGGLFKAKPENRKEFLPGLQQGPDRHPTGYQPGLYIPGLSRVITASVNLASANRPAGLIFR